jgi:hypothetical protein
MTEHRNSRTLVKSVPELWAECTDPAALARHLGSVGEIRITRLEPERTVAWEGAAARGTVSLQPAGWGTRVTLTVSGPEAEAGVEIGGEAAAPDPVSAGSAEAPERVGPLRRLLWRLRGWPAEAAPSADLAASDRSDADAEAPAQAPSPPAAAPVAEVEAPAPSGGESALSAALDSLGGAHRRPYSRS